LSLGPHWYGKRSLGENLELHEVDRQERDIRTIESFDVTAEQRVAYNLEKERLRGEKRRREAGAQPREQYLANSKSRTKPWEAAGFKCRRTWERHQERVASASASLLELTQHADGLATNASPSQPIPAEPSAPVAERYRQSLARR
jgi:hypothetical protein